MFWHLFKYRLKVLLKDRALLFWTLIFPLVLATFFNLAFSNLAEAEKFKAIDIAVVNNEAFKNDTNFKTVIGELSAKGDDQVFITKYVDEAKAEKLLEDNKVVGYILVGEKIDVIVKTTGFSQTIIKSVINSYYQNINAVSTIASINPEAIKNGILEELGREHNYLKAVTNKNTNDTVVYFYSLIGMVCLYGGMLGIGAIKDVEANLSKRASRITVTPVHKAKALLAFLLVSFLVQYVEILLLLAYLTFGLNVGFGDQIIYILIVSFFGSLAGLSLGTFIGVSNKQNENMKGGILISITMALSFMSGMMILEIRYLISQHMPILAYINPVNMVTDGLYALYYYDTLNRYLLNVMSLALFSLIMIVLSYVLLRRKSYDSI